MNRIFASLVCFLLMLSGVSAPAAEANATTETNATSDENGTKPGDPDSNSEGDETDKPEPPSWFDKLKETGPIGLLITGGWFMLPILLLAILALAVIIERWRSLKMLNTDNEALRQAVLDDLTNDRPDDALARCDKERGPVAAVLANGMRKYIVLRKLGYDAGRLEEQVVKSMESYGVHIVAALERHLPVLAIISSVAPMLGFLGTVAGMIESFNDIVQNVESGTSKNIVTDAAEGIRIALLTTCFGLMVGIPAFMAFNYFSSVINNFVLEVEESATQLMEAVTLQLTLDKAADQERRE
ncbi:MAG: MotA/TolQ/ExbB proton channel family protein [Verrucomicrobiota bacterium]|jgi:biopolymer transport protein ExbB|nr:MotA/TolQ/ExbB proton channel family protein [Verrucomicrobiota bacterium]